MDEPRTEPATATPSLASDGSTAPAEAATAKAADGPQLKAGIPAIRTFKQDLAYAIKHQNLSLAGAALREAERRSQRLVSERRVSRTKVFLIAASFLAVAASSVWLWSFFNLPEEENTPEARLAKSFITTDTGTKLDVSSKSIEAARASLASQIKNELLRIGLIARLDIYQTLTDSEGLLQKNSLSTSQFLRTFGILPPAGLPRFLEEDFLLGIHSFKENSGFLMFKTTSFQSVFASLLEWEKNMALDLYPILAGEPLASQVRLLNFGDEIIKNIDARVLRGADGEIILIYSFLNTRDTLLITTNQATFNEVLTRFQTPRQVVQ